MSRSGSVIERGGRTRAKRTIARSRLAPLVALPIRARIIGKHDLLVIKRSLTWLATSREHTNFTYDITEINKDHLAWYIAAVAGAPVSAVRGYISELESDETLAAHVRSQVLRSNRKGIADPVARYGRRLGWYALARCIRPHHIVETGTDKGLGSCVLAAAILRNGFGRLTTFDINPESGYMIDGKYAQVVDRQIEPSVNGLADLEFQTDLFIHDSLHTSEYEIAELAAMSTSLSDEAVVLSDNAHRTNALSEWAENTGRTFLYFGEQPAYHWHPGGGIGAAYYGPVKLVGNVSGSGG